MPLEANNLLQGLAPSLFDASSCVQTEAIHRNTASSRGDDFIFFITKSSVDQALDGPDFLAFALTKGNAMFERCRHT